MSFGALLATTPYGHNGSERFLERFPKSLARNHFLAERPIQAVSLERKQIADALPGLLHLKNTDHNSNELS